MRIKIQEFEINILQLYLYDSQYYFFTTIPLLFFFFF